MNPKLCGLYVITDNRHDSVETLVDAVSAALQGGARVVQYRDKSQDAVRRQAEAAALRALCRQFGVPFLVNDEIELARTVQADGVHLGRDDASIATARAALPPGSIVGRSCYNDLDLARAAADAGADYIAFGSFFSSPTKPEAVTASPELLRRARRELDLPAVAIGGITPENGAALVAAGASMLAVITAVFSAPDVTLAARAFTSCFNAAEEIPS